jgi:predicted transcriptional regulator
MQSRRRDSVKQTTVRLPDDLAAQAEIVARVRGTSLNALLVEALAAELARTGADKRFTSRAREAIKRDKDAIRRLAR